MKDMRYVTILGATGKHRIEMFQGREHVVVPVVALVEGVIHAVNSPQPELVTAEEFSHGYESWNGRPIFPGHPVRSGVPVSGNSPEVLTDSIGLIFNTRVDKNKLPMELFFDPEKCSRTAKGRRILEKARADEGMEVSVGVFVHPEPAEGEFNGKRYAAKWRRPMPDHIAVLGENEIGACSREMGCGTHRVAMRVAADGSWSEEAIAEDKRAWLSRITSAIGRWLQPRGWGDDEVKQELYSALLKVEPMLRYGDIVRVKNDIVIYVLYPPPSPSYVDPSYMAWPENSVTYWQREYEFDSATQSFKVSGEKTEVAPATVYEPVKRAASSGCGCQSTSGGCSCGGHAHNNQPARTEGVNAMDRVATIKALAANPHSPVKSLKMLEAATDEELAALQTTAEEAKAAADKPAPAAAPAAVVTAPVVAAAAPAATVTPEPKTEQQWLDEAPAAVREEFVALRAAREAAKTELVSKLKTACSGTYSEEELKAKSIDELKKLATLMKVDEPKRDFSGLGLPRVAASVNNEVAAAPDSWAPRQAS